jgi:spermidine synthase
MELAFFEEDRTATVSVFSRSWDDHLSLRINGVEEVPVDQPSLEAFYLLGHLPWGYNPSAEEAMAVALGGGITCGALLAHPLDTLACADLCPSLLEALPLFADLNRRPDLDPRFEFVVDDGRNFLLGSGNDWDIVICDATHPGSVDSWVLYTREFYRTVLDRLDAGGVAAQWVPLHQLPVEEMLRILTTWSGVFPHSAAHVAGGRHLVLVGSADSLMLDVQEVFEDPGAAGQLESVGYSPRSPEQLMPALDPAEMGSLARNAGLYPNTDLRAPCQFIQEKVTGFGQGTIAPNVAYVASLSGESPSRLLSAQMLYWRGDLPAAAEMLRPPQNPLEARWLSVVLTTGAEQLHLSGRSGDALWMLQRAMEADPEWYRPRALRALIAEEAG